MVFRRLAVGHVNRALSTLDGVAGKSVNVVKVLKELGEDPLAVGVLGGDRGDHIKSSLGVREIQTDFVQTSARTRQCITVIDESDGAQTELVEEGLPLDQNAFESLRKVISAHIPLSAAAVMSGTIARGIPPEFYAECTRMANQTGVLSVVDAHGQALELALPEQPALVKPNRSELASTVGRALNSDEELLNAMRELQHSGARRVVVTSGAAPAFAFDGVASWRITTPPVAVVNAIGSGDAFTAAVVWRLLKGDDLGEACRWGTAAGAANALTLMPGELKRSDVEALAPRVQVERVT